LVLIRHCFSLEEALNLCSIKIKKAAPFGAAFEFIAPKNYFFLEALMVDWAAAKRAIGTRNGEQLT